VGRKATGPTGIAGLQKQKKFCRPVGYILDTGSFLAFVTVKGEMIMSILKKCPFYRDSKSLAIGRGLGHCDLFGQAICEGDIRFCEKPDLLRKRLSEQQRNEVCKNEGEQGQKNPSKYKVLVVDDEEPLRKLIVAILSGQSHQCLTAGNGVDALNKASQIKFDAVITDIVMPEMNGIALTRKLLSLYPKLPVMIMTGYSKNYPTGFAIAAGARDFIGKPFSNDEFILRFNKMMKDQEISLEIEAKQREILFQSQRESSERINELKREIENLTSRLSNGYRGVRL
jgi:CheY-like chemotaxis protein